LNRFTRSPTITTPKHIFISSAPNTKDSTICSVAPETHLNTSPSFVKTASGELNLVEEVSTKDLSSSTNTSNVQVSSANNKRNLSPCAEKKQGYIKKSNTKTEQTRERAYNDNSLLSDSMIIEQEKLLEDINNVEIPDMALTQVAEQADDSFSSQGNVEEINSPVPSNSNYLSSPSNNIINIIKAVTILHNLCIMSDDGLEIEWNLPLPTHKKPGCNMQTTSGVDVRAALTEYFLQNPL
ncbi:unnamed protein product, partial [Rotaria sp. Silwood2]